MHRSYPTRPPLADLVVVDLPSALRPLLHLDARDMGARVIKSSLRGGRSHGVPGPPFVGGESAYF